MNRVNLLAGVGAAFERECARACHFDDFVIAQELHEGIDFVLVAREFDDDAFERDVDDLSAENPNDLQNFGARLLVRLNLDHNEFACNEINTVKILNGNDVDELVQLADATVQGFVVCDNGCRDSGNIRIVCRSDVQRFDIKAATAKHAGNASENAKFIFNQSGNCVLVHIAENGRR